MERRKIHFRKKTKLHVLRTVRGGQRSRIQTRLAHQRNLNQKTKRQKIEGDCSFDWTTLKWPDFNGCDGREQSLTFQVGETYDRYGSEKGYFLGDLRNTFDQRSMAAMKPGARCSHVFRNRLLSKEQQYRQYRVLKPFVVKTCKVAPFFGHPGGGIQYRLFPGTIPLNEQSLIEYKTNEAAGDHLKPNVEEMVKLGYLQDVGRNIIAPKFSAKERATRLVKL